MGQKTSLAIGRKQMGYKTKISWCDSTWNPIKGCSKVSPGCDNCWAERMAARFCNPDDHFYGLTHNGKWSGSTVRLYKKELSKPLHWKRPRIIAVCLMGDLYNENVPFEWIDQVFHCIKRAKQHTFLILTKRPQRMLSHASEWIKSEDILPMNAYFGVSVENQAAADARIHVLREMSTFKLFVSVEPLLGLLDIRRHLGLRDEPCQTCGAMEEIIVTSHKSSYFFRHQDKMSADEILEWEKKIKKASGKSRCCKRCNEAARNKNFISWVIVGGESGPGSRPMHPRWATQVLDQCQETYVPFFFKQHGAWIGESQLSQFSTDEPPPNIERCKHGNLTTDGSWKPGEDARGDGEDARGDGEDARGDGERMFRVGKKAAGNYLNGKIYEEFPWWW